MAEEFTFSNVRRAVNGIARYVKVQRSQGARVIVGRDPRFLGETFCDMACEILSSYGITPLIVADATRGSSPFDEFAALPRRLYLDSSTLQTIERYGEFVWENVEVGAGDRAYGIPGFLDDLDALRFIFQVNERAMFDIVVSHSAIAEVADKRDGPYLRWVSDVASHWRERIDEYRGGAFSGRGTVASRTLDEPRFGYLSAKDRNLIRAAIAAECAAFITMEKRLPKNATHFAAATGMKLLRPPEYARLLMPWAALFR